MKFNIACPETGRNKVVELQNEEKMSHTADDMENFKRSSEKLLRENSDLKKKIDVLIQKEDRTINQYEKIMD